MHQCQYKIGGWQVKRQGSDMLSGMLVAKGDLMEAIVLKGQIGYPKNIGPRPIGFMP